MPSSFSRFLTEEEMQRVRQLHLQSLRDTDLDGQAEAHSPGDDADGDAQK